MQIKKISKKRKRSRSSEKKSPPSTPSSQSPSSNSPPSSQRSHSRTQSRSRSRSRSKSRSRSHSKSRSRSRSRSRSKSRSRSRSKSRSRSHSKSRSRSRSKARSKSRSRSRSKSRSRSRSRSRSKSRSRSHSKSRSRSRSRSRSKSRSRSPPLDPYGVPIGFRNRIPWWGAHIIYNNERVFVSDTCTVDYGIFAFWVLSKINRNFTLDLPDIQPKKNNIIRMINNVEQDNWDMARQIWVNDIMNLNTPVGKKKRISLYGTQELMFNRYVNEFQSYRLVKNCRITCVENNLTLPGNRKEIFLAKKGFDIYATPLEGDKCTICKTNMTFKYNFIYNIDYLIIDVYHEIPLYNVPKQLSLENSQGVMRFKLILATIGTGRHFKSCFLFNGIFYLVDDLDQSCNQLPVFDGNTRSRRNKIPFMDTYLKKTSTLFYKLI